MPRSRSSHLLALGLLVSLPALGRAQTRVATSPPPARRAVTIEDFYRVRTAGSPVISPDGRWVAFTVSSRVEETNAEPSEVWVATTDGTIRAKRVSAAGTSATDPRWRAGALDFRAGTSRWRVNPARSDSLTPIPVESPTAGELRIDSPVAGRTALLRDVPPPPLAADRRTPFEQRHDARFQGRQFDWLNFQRDGARYPVPDRTNPRLFPTQELWLVDGAGSAPRPLTQLGLRPQGVQWNRTGTALVFWADSGYRDERRYPAAAVYVADVTGTVRRLTPERDLDCDNALFSPDGKWVLYTRQISTNTVIAQKLDHGSPTDLALRPAGGGAERVLTADWDLIPENATWSADGRWIYFSAAIAGAQHLFRVAATGGRVEQVTTGARRLSSITIDSSFTRIAYTATGIDAPADVYVAAIDGTNERRLSDVNAELTRDVAWSRADRLQFPSADGTPVEGWLLLPHNYDGSRRYPLVLSNHGGPHAADGYAFDFKSQLLAASGYFVLKVNFRSSTGYGEPFLWATWGAWGTKDGQDVMAGVDYAIAKYPIDRTRVATMGHSYGGFMTNWLITQYPDRFAAAIPGAGIVNWVSDYGTADIAVTKETEFYGTPWDSAARERMIRQSPLTYAGRVRTPTLFVHGEIDERVPYSEAEQMFVALKKNGVPAAIIQYKDMPHSISGSWNQVHRMLHERDWLDQWLRKPTP
jgi:dipeptidyl aminopeptidase/acylaminoacyl peptidase